MSSEESRTPLGRPRLRTQEEIRAACIRGGVDLLTTGGLQIDMRGLTIEAAAKVVGIPRASSYRAWKSDAPDSRASQGTFQSAVAVQVLSNVVAEDGEVFEAVLELLASIAGAEEPLDIAEMIAQMSEAERTNAFARCVAAGTIANLDSLRDNTLFHVHAGLVAALNSQESPAPAVSAAMADGDALAATRWVDLYRFMFAIFGMRMKAHYQFEHLALAGAALAFGLGQKQHYDFSNTLRRPVADPVTGERIFDDTPWNLFGAGSMGLIAEFCEADPTSGQPTDPRQA